MTPTVSYTASNPEEVRFEVWLALNAPHDPEEDGEPETLRTFDPFARNPEYEAWLDEHHGELA